MMCDFEHLFMCLFSICLSFLVRYMFISFAYLKNKVANFLIVEFLKFFIHIE